MSNRPDGSGVSLESLVAEFGGRLSAPNSIAIANVATVANATSTSITFAVDARRAKEANNSLAGCILMREADAEHCPDRLRWFHPDPYFAYAKVAQRLFPRARANAGVHPSAVVDSAAHVDPTAEIGPFVFLAPGARVGARARLHAGVRLGRNCVVGEDSELFPNVTMYVGCEIGARAIVHAGVVIGADGFGFAPHKGAWEKIPQTGRVRIGDDVEIGANTTIDRGALDDTIIGNGVKLDNQIQIGHNCVVGDHTAMAGCVGIAGSTTIGKHCMIGGAARIVGHVSIVDGTVISAGTIVSDEIKVPGRYTGVFPTLEHSAWRRMAARVRRLATKDER